MADSAPRAARLADRWRAGLDPGLPDLKVVPFADGTVKSVAKLESFVLFGGSWASDDSILFSTGKSVARVSISGGAPEVLFEGDEGEEILLPAALPGTNAVLYTVQSNAGSSVVVARLDTQ